MTSRIRNRGLSNTVPDIAGIKCQVRDKSHDKPMIPCSLKSDVKKSLPPQ